MKAKDVLGVPLEEGQLVAVGTGSKHRSILAATVKNIGEVSSSGWAFVHVEENSTGMQWMTCSDELLVVDGFRGEQ